MQSLQESHECKIITEKYGILHPMQQLEMSVFETQENLAIENLTMKTRNALCHIQVVILYSKTSSYIVLEPSHN